MLRICPIFTWGSPLQLGVFKPQVFSRDQVSSVRLQSIDCRRTLTEGNVRVKISRFFEQEMYKMWTDWKRWGDKELRAITEIILFLNYIIITNAYLFQKCMSSERPPTKQMCVFGNAKMPTLIFSSTYQTLFSSNIKLTWKYECFMNKLLSKGKKKFY